MRWLRIESPVAGLLAIRPGVYAWYTGAPTFRPGVYAVCCVVHGWYMGDPTFRPGVHAARPRDRVHRKYIPIRPRAAAAAADRCPLDSTGVVLIDLDGFEALDGAAGVVVFALVFDVFDDPRQVAFAEGDDAVAGLPREGAQAARPVIDGVRARAFEVADPRGEFDGGGHADGHVHVVFDAADGVDDHAGGAECAVDEVAVCFAFDVGGQEWLAVFGPPDEVKVKFPIHIAGHVGSVQVVLA